MAQSLNHNKEYNANIRKWLEKVFRRAKYLSSQTLLERNCPVCGSGNYSFYANNDYFDYARCNNCLLLFQNPTIDVTKVASWYKGEDDVIAEYFNVMAKYKTQIPDKPDPLRDNKLVDIYKVKKTGRLLDIGCSVGDFLHKAKYFYNVEGCEVNPVTSEIAKQYFTIHQGLLHELDLKEPYDIITLHQILYGVSDPVGLLKDICKVLKQDGILYINTPNADSYAMDLFKGKTNHLYGYTTQNIFNYSSLEKLAKLSGLKIKTFRTEWMDIYISDILTFLGDPEIFIHKRNCQINNYEEIIKMEDELHEKLQLDLKNKGNYLVAILERVK